MSTPKKEGGINDGSVQGLQDLSMNFQLIVNKERVVTEQEVNKPHNSLQKPGKRPQGIKMIG